MASKKNEKGAKEYFRAIAEDEFKSHKNRKWKVRLIILAVLLLVIINGVLFVPLPYQRYNLSTDKIQYNAQESYQETVNRNSCDDASGCVCTAHGGFLWLTCTQCSCTRQRTVVRERLILKESTITSYATSYQTLTHSRISEDEAREIAQTLITFISQNNVKYSMGDISKDNGFWRIEIVGISEGGYIWINPDNGKIVAMGEVNQINSFDIQEINNQIK